MSDPIRTTSPGQRLRPYRVLVWRDTAWHRDPKPLFASSPDNAHDTAKRRHPDQFVACFRLSSTPADVLASLLSLSSPMEASR